MESIAAEQSPYNNLTGQIVNFDKIPFTGGGFSNIHKGEWKNPDTDKTVRVALKVLRIYSTSKDREVVMKRLYRETKVWHSLEHKNVTPFLGLCHDVGPFPAMVSYLCDNGHVNEYLVKNNKADRLEIITAIARGLQYLHSQNVVHGDVKGSNVLVSDDGTPQLSDFGRSRVIDHRGFTTATLAGSVRQLAPEFIQPEEVYSGGDIPTAIKMTKEGDIYAFAMVALEIRTGKKPFFWLRNDYTVLFNVQKGEQPERSKYPTIVHNMWPLLVNCWDRDPSKRLDIGIVMERLETV